MLQKLSDAELEIMKIIWENPETTTLFSCLMEQLAAQGKPCQKNTLIVLADLPPGQTEAGAEAQQSARSQAAAEADHGDMRLKRGHILPEAAAFAGKYLWVIWLL